MSDSEGSELTDLEEDELDTGTATRNSAAKGKKKGKTAGGYKMKGILPVPRATTYTARALYEQINSADINLEPEYQRDVVWTAQKQIGIIDSIFRNFYIPPIIFAVNVSDEGGETRTCIDGKQRLTSIYRFMDGLIPHKDPMTNEKLWYKDVADGKARAILPDAMRKMFANKQIVCVEYHDITEDNEREIFQRVQLGMALTPAEKLQVIKSPRSDYIRDLLDAYVENDGPLAGDNLHWDTRRGTDFRCLAMAAFYMEKPSNAGFSTLISVEKWISDARQPTESWYDKVGGTLAIFAHITKDKTLRKSITKAGEKFAPVEFIACTILISTHKDTMSVSQLAWSMAEMRKDLRKQFQDIRMNTRVSKAAVTFINSLKSKKIGGTAGKSASSLVATPPRETLRAASRSQKKRKRVEDDEDEEEGGGPSNSRGKGKTATKSNKAVKSSPSPSPELGGDMDVDGFGSGPPRQPSPPPVRSTAAPSAARSSRMAAIQAAKEAAGHRPSSYGSLSAAQFNSVPIAPITNPSSLSLNPASFGSLPPQQSSLAVQSPTLTTALLRAGYSSATPSGSTPPISPQLGANLEANLMNKVGIAPDASQQYSPHQPQHAMANHSHPGHAPSPLGQPNSTYPYPQPTSAYGHHPLAQNPTPQPQPQQQHIPISIPIPHSSNDEYNRRHEERERDQSRDWYERDRDRERERERGRGGGGAWDRESRDGRDRERDTRGWGRGPPPLSGSNANGHGDSGWGSRNGR